VHGSLIQEVANDERKYIVLHSTKITETNFAYFSKFDYHTSSQDSIVSGANLAPT
jgi:hypothetical protein